MSEAIALIIIFYILYKVFILIKKLLLAIFNLIFKRNNKKDINYRPANSINNKTSNNLYNKTINNNLNNYKKPINIHDDSFVDFKVNFDNNDKIIDKYYSESPKDQGYYDNLDESFIGYNDSNYEENYKFEPDYYDNNTKNKKTGFKEINYELDSIVLGDEQKAIFDEINLSNDNYFITGKAGTGKSVLLQYFVAHTKKKTAVVAPTGVAALNVGGQTIHSFFIMGTDVQNPSIIKDVANLSNNKIEVLRKLDVLIIDEISMVSVDVMDMIDAKLKLARGNNEPFGGCQLIVFGDLFQLPPVVTNPQVSRYLEDKYGTVYFYGIDSIKNNPFKIVELQYVYRQEDSNFINILNDIRLGICDDETLNKINESCVLEPKDDKFITLTGTNSTADRINKQKLDEIASKEYTYEASVFGDFKKSSMPTDMILHLKVGAHVMMIKNDKTDNTSEKKNEKARWVNGTLGVISYLSQDVIKVLINGVEHAINKEVWHTYKYMYDANKKELCKEEEGSFIQYPVRLAWAITIHKSQGQTYDAVKIDLSNGAFATGQTYVALSRCRSMDYLYLNTPIKHEDVIVSQEIIEYMKNKELIKIPENKKIGVDICVDKKYKIWNVEQSSKEWLDLRVGKVTGTTAHYLKKHDVEYAISKNDYDDGTGYVSDAMIRGKELENEGIDLFSKKTGINVSKVGFIESLEYENTGYSPDGVVFDDNGRIETIIEHKAFESIHHFTCAEKIDTNIMYQIQFGMFITGAKDAYLILYNPDLMEKKDQLIIKHIFIENNMHNLFKEKLKKRH